MKEPTKDRISRLKARKQELLGQIKKLRGDPGARNVEHKIARLDAQVLRIGERINKLKGVNNANS